MIKVSSPEIREAKTVLRDFLVRPHVKDHDVIYDAGDGRKLYGVSVGNITPRIDVRMGTVLKVPPIIRMDAFSERESQENGFDVSAWDIREGDTVGFRWSGGLQDQVKEGDSLLLELNDMLYAIGPDGEMRLMPSLVYLEPKEKKEIDRNGILVMDYDLRPNQWRVMYDNGPVKKGDLVSIQSGWGVWEFYMGDKRHMVTYMSVVEAIYEEEA